MAAGVSSRMKSSKSNKNLSEDQIKQSNSKAKGFIEVGKKNETIIYHIIKNSVIAGRQSYLSGRIEKSFLGSPSSPKKGII